MTDIATREEVKTTTSMIETALTLPVDPQIRREVRRFGFEYEMLRQGHQDEYGNDELQEALSDHMETWLEEYQDRDDYCCDECESAADAEERRSFIREYQRTHGYQQTSPSGGPQDLMQRAYGLDLISDPSAHSYHCDCGDCDYSREGPLMTAQNDCTCGVEFVSRIIDLLDFDNAKADIAAWVEMMNGWKDDGHWMPDGHYANGNHVHVSSDGDDQVDGAWNGTPTRQKAYAHINAVYAAFDWTGIADGGCGSIRGYNSKPTLDRRQGNWLSDRGYGTFEHRLWNTPAVPERLWAHLGISVGIQRWAFNIAHQMPEASLWTQGTDGYGYNTFSMDDKSYATVTTNVGEIVRGIRAYIPQHDQFDIARDLIVNLTPTH